MASPNGNPVLRYLRRLGAGSLLISIGVHVAVISVATVYVISSVKEQRKAAFQGGSGSGDTAPAPAMVQHQVQMSRQQPNLSAINQRLAVDSPDAAVSLPDTLEMPGFSGGGPSLSANPGGLGGGSGAGAGLGKGPIMPAFGFRDAQAGGSFVGRLYDLKQLKDRSPNRTLEKFRATMRGIAPYDELMAKEIDELIQSNWRSGYLDSKFYRSETPLYATQIFVPEISADDAPKAYEAEKNVQPRCWVAHYRGRVSPATTGFYRFVGGADDVLVVRLNGRIVLDGGILNASEFKTDRPEKPVYTYDFTRKSLGLNVLTARRGGFVVGHRMELRAGVFYDLDVVIGESPGGFFFANLLVEQEGVDYPKDRKGNPILPLLRLSDAASPDKKLNYPPFQENGPVWRALAPPN